MNWAHLGTVIVAAFLASLVECVEALTIVMAVGTTRGWRPALTGAGAGAFVLTVVTLVAGPALQRIPLTSLQLVIGVLLLIFGMRWLVKAILRASGVIGLHNEAAIYAQEKAVLARDRGGDRVAVLTAFKAVILEGLEVIFIVIAVGAHGLLAPAAAGAALAACRARPDRFDALIVGHFGSTMSSLEIAAALHDVAPHLPIVLATKSSEEIGADRLVGTGIADVVHWPIITAEVAAALNQCLSPPRPEAKPQAGYSRVAFPLLYRTASRQ